MNRHRRVAFPLPGVPLVFRWLRPKSYPERPASLGGHLLKRQTLVSVTQREIANRMGVNVSTYLLWETDKTAPTVRYWPAIVSFLGYEPWPAPSTLTERLAAKRRLLGSFHRGSRGTRWRGRRHIPALGKRRMEAPYVRRRSATLFGVHDFEGTRNALMARSQHHKHTDLPDSQNDSHRGGGGKFKPIFFWYFEAGKKRRTLTVYRSEAVFELISAVTAGTSVVQAVGTQNHVTSRSVYGRRNRGLLSYFPKTAKPYAG